MSDWITPVETWNDKDAPVGSDFNRIEKNTRVNHELIASEEEARETADSNLQTNINTVQTNLNTEAGTRGTNDSALQTQITSLYNALSGISYGSYTELSIPTNSGWEPPTGLYMVVVKSGDCELRLKDTSGYWQGTEKPSGLIISNAGNCVIRTGTSIACVLAYRKIY